MRIRHGDYLRAELSFAAISRPYGIDVRLTKGHHTRGAVDNLSSAPDNGKGGASYVCVAYAHLAGSVPLLWKLIWGIGHVVETGISPVLPEMLSSFECHLMSNIQRHIEMKTRMNMTMIYMGGAHKRTESKRASLFER